MSTTLMASPTFSFDESKFIYKFARDYHTEIDFDLDSSFHEYFQNFIESNSDDYNMYVFHRLRIKFKIRPDQVDITIREYLYEKLYEIIAKGMEA
jgi:hypothetical protein